MENDLSVLDPRELLHLAIIDGREGRKDAALIKLKRAAQLAPDHAVIRHQLGAHYADIGLMDRAEEEIGNAVMLDPLLHVARFQLGLLQFAGGRLDEAVATWSPLDSLVGNDDLRLFKEALLLREGGRLEESATVLEQALNTSGEAGRLSEYIRRTLTAVRERLAAAVNADADEPAAHALAARYRDPTLQ